MISIDGKNYYIDLTAVMELITADKDFANEEKTVIEHYAVDENTNKEVYVGKEVETTSHTGKIINDVNYSLIQSMIGVLLTPREGFQGVETMVTQSTKLEDQSIDFKLAFNTLFKNKILKFY